MFKKGWTNVNMNNNRREGRGSMGSLGSIITSAATFFLIISTSTSSILLLSSSMLTTLTASVSAVPVTARLLRDADDGKVVYEGLKNDQISDKLGFPKSSHHHPMNTRRLHLARHRRRNLRWLKEALTYLRSYGYLDEGALRPSEVWEALGAAQDVFGLHITGSLDRKTMDAMKSPRCGNKDITPSPENSAAEEPTNHQRSKRFAPISRWAVGEDGELNLRWFIEKYTDDITPHTSIKEVVRKALQLWADQVSIPSQRNVLLKFTETDSKEKSDINIKWAQGEHGDEFPFDGNGTATNVLAHTFYPDYQAEGSLSGNIHFDDHEKWTMNGKDGVHFPYVLVHEIGHALGLGHSKSQNAVMNPIYKKHSLDKVKLNMDDKCAFHWNYIGKTTSCLFVWLLAELLPLAREHNLASNAIGSMIGNNSVANLETDFLAERTLESRINVTFESFKKASIPFCSETNDVQLQYEVLLEQRLEFPTKKAKQFGPMVCNFLSGASKFQSRLDPTTENNQIGQMRMKKKMIVARMGVHAYQRHTSLSAVQHNGDLDLDLAEAEAFSYSSNNSNQIVHHRNIRRRSHGRQRRNTQPTSAGTTQMGAENSTNRRQPSSNPTSFTSSASLNNNVFSQDYFDHDFFQNLIRIMVDSPYAKY